MPRVPEEGPTERVTYVVKQARHTTSAITKSRGYYVLLIVHDRPTDDRDTRTHLLFACDLLCGLDLFDHTTMGACASCLGRGDGNAYDEEEENRLLYDDANGMQYGSFGDQAISGENDTLEAQRENEALQRVVAKTSDNMVDIFDIAPQENVARGTTTPFAYAGQGARLARYQHLVSKLSSQGDNSPVSGVKVDWLPEDETIEMQKNGPASIKTLESDKGPLVGTFADAAAAMQ
ncbi:hypothetical protein FSARC_6112 [Fusarium sarcochroum]|uniref:Uncharacterized protein n=1 Tax=Fusarium sarcochroum TaxID=1208366 RepID=A0A8H4X8W0_9HYPO|nr:hypothetical protein FSARC_6112 [Fusarium sarcochroum]